MIVERYVTMQTNSGADVEVDPRTLPADSFTASDRARIELGCQLQSIARQVEGLALLLGEDLAVAGDYVRRARQIELCYEDVIDQAVIAERVRGTTWERIGEVFHLAAHEAEARWAKKVERRRNETKASSIYVRDPGGYARQVDDYLLTGRANPLASARVPLSPVLDAAAPLTGRDVARADKAFAGTDVCTTCHR